MTKPVIRCSSLPRLLSCHGSKTVGEIVAPRKGLDGDEGTYLHWLIASRLIKEYGAIDPEGGLPDPVLSPTFKTPKQSLWIVDWALREVRDTIPATWGLMVELELLHEFDRFLLLSHQDVRALSPGGIRTRGKDWKTGYEGVVPAEENDQVLGYEVSTKLSWSSIQHSDFDLCQPRLSEDGDFPRISTSTLDGAQLDDCVASLEKRVNAALDDPYSLVSGDHCKWCVCLQCPCLQAELDFMETQLTPELLATLKHTPDDALLGKLYLAARTLNKPLEDLDDLVNERLDRGPMTLEDGRPLTIETQNAGIKVTDPVAYYKHLCEVIPDPEKRALAMNFIMGRTIDIISEITGLPKGGASGHSSRDLYLARFSPFFENRFKKVKKVGL